MEPICVDPEPELVLRQIDNTCLEAQQQRSGPHRVPTGTIPQIEPDRSQDPVREAKHEARSLRALDHEADKETCQATQGER